MITEFDHPLGGKVRILQSGNLTDVEYVIHWKDVGKMLLSRISPIIKRL